MKLHIGERIKARARELKIGPTEFGKLINTTKQNVTGIYSRASIDSSLLFEISKVLQFNFFKLYDLSQLESENDNKYVKQIVDLKKENARLKSDYQACKEQNKLMNKINILLEKQRARK